jgi:pimeloyl-ACP methyl ester carboxylesterase
MERNAMSTTFENATTKSVDVNGTSFVLREVGKKGGIPVMLLHHLTAVLDDWDPTSNGQISADGFLQRLKERTKDLDAPVSNETVQAQIAAIQVWGQGDATMLGTVQHPVLVVNGDHDVMVPSFNSFELARTLPKAQLSIFPDAGHGGIFQHHATFVQQALAFLQQ